MKTTFPRSPCSSKRAQWRHVSSNQRFEHSEPHLLADCATKDATAAADTNHVKGTLACTSSGSLGEEKNLRAKFNGGQHRTRSSKLRSRSEKSHNSDSKVSLSFTGYRRKAGSNCDGARIIHSQSGYNQSTKAATRNTLPQWSLAP